jgi:hypothetical protein
VSQRSQWTAGELDQIGNAEEVRIASARRDGTLRSPVTTWIVRQGGDLYVRSVRGTGGQWFRGVQERHEGRIRAGGADHEVTFVDADREISDEVDAAYRHKYRRYAGAILDSVLTSQARSATLKVVPRSTT